MFALLAPWRSGLGEHVLPTGSTPESSYVLRIAAS